MYLTKSRNKSSNAVTILSRKYEIVRHIIRLGPWLLLTVSNTSKKKVLLSVKENIMAQKHKTETLTSDSSHLLNKCTRNKKKFPQNTIYFPYREHIH